MTSQKRSRSFGSHTATYAIGNIARRVVGFAMLPIYTRFLTPADYGVVGLLAFALALFEPLFGARLGWAIPKFYFDARDSRARRAVIWSALGLTGAASAASVVLLILLRGVGAEILFGNRKYALALGVFAITLLSQPIEQTGMTYLRLREQSRLFLVFSMVKLVLQLGLNLLLVVHWKQGVLGVVLSAVISSVLLGIGSTIYVAVHEAPVFDWQLTRRMLQFCWPMWLSGLAGLYIGSSGAVFLRMFATLGDVGRLELAVKFSAVVGILEMSPFFQHWEPMSYQYHKEEGGQRKFQVAFITISALMFAGWMGISIFSAPVIRLMATTPFYAAASVVPIVTLGFIVNSLRQFFNFSFFVTANTKIHSLCQYGTAGVITVAYLLLVPRFGLMGAALAQTLAFAINFIFVHLLSRRYYDPGFKLAPLGFFLVIGASAYICSNVVFRASNLEIDLLVKSLVSLIALVLMALVWIRFIRAVEGASLETLPWPLDKLGRIQLSRQSGC
ncbi:MAG: oligosaccharide flippase family protein [Pseudomonadota bacterium]|jgi:O-antigen/teichoic acid export membrane protein|nr:oligosaccharide flippase family protein [Pseudomonadota bacterium]